MRIAIIGAGFSGTSLTIELLRRAPRGTEILLIERGGSFGPGLAYSTPDPRHLLNVRASNMSALADDPTHFVRWLWSLPPGENEEPEVPPSGHAFVARSLYGRYLTETLEEAERRAYPGVVVERLHRNVDGLAQIDGGVELRFAGGGFVTADVAVVATGNFPPELPAASGCAGCDPVRLIRDSWAEGALERIGPEDSVIVLGTGLTMVDVVLRLELLGHRGPIRAVSRRGILPRIHKQVQSLPPLFDTVPQTITTAALTRLVRAEVAKAMAGGFDWRAVIDALRPVTQDLWKAMPLAERRRFLRHVRPWWEVHRHRMAPKVAERIEAGIAAGRLVIEAARIEAFEPLPDAVAVTVRPRAGGAARRLEAAFVINCSGPQTDYTRIGDPLVRALLAEGVARPDPLHLGLDVDERNALVDAQGRPGDRIFAIGPVTKGHFWEITAVPDIRRQTSETVLRLLSRFSQPLPQV